MTSLTKATLSSNTSRKVTQPESLNGTISGHDLAVGGNNVPGKGAKKDQQGKERKFELDQAVQNASDYAKKAGRRLGFTVEQATNRTIVTVIDQETGKAIRQIPIEEMLALAKLLSDVQGPGEDAILKGLFIDQDT